MPNTGTEKNAVEDASSAEKIAEAKIFLERSQQVEPDVAKAEFEAERRAEFDAAIAQEDAHHFKQLLAQCDGSYETLAIKLHHFLRKQSREKKQAEQQKNAKEKKAGRPAERWGEDGAGKLMVAAIIDAELGKMRSDGNPNPKIKDAIARAYDIPDAKRHLTSNKKTINDYARTYSEIKAVKNNKE